MTLNRRDAFRAMAGAAVTAAVHGQQPIPPHPRDLVFDEPTIELPNRERFRRPLSSGAVAYMVESHDIPLVTVGLNLLGGEYTVPAGSAGLASLTASQLRVGGTTSRSAQDFNDAVAFLATEMHSGATGTAIGATMTCLTSSLDRSLDLFFDSLKNPAFDPERLEIDRSTVILTLARRNDWLGGVLEREFNRLIRGSHFSTVQPTQASIESITPESMRRYHTANYDPGRMHFAVSGDFDTETMVRRLNAELASGWPGNATAPASIPAPTHQPVPGVYMIDSAGRDLNQAHVILGHSGIEESHPDAANVQLMNVALGAGPSSRIGTRVRSAEGLAYSVGSRYDPGSYFQGLFSAQFQSGNATCAQAATIVVEEIRRMQNEKLSVEELETVRGLMSSGIAEFFEDRRTIANRFALDELAGRPADYWQRFREEAMDVTADDILSVAQRHLRPDELVIVAVGNQSELLKGNPDRPEYSFESLAGGAGIRSLPLPNPLTMQYPT